MEKKKVYGMVRVIKWRQFAVEMHSITKVHGEVNSVKNTNINIWLNDGIY